MTFGRTWSIVVVLCAATGLYVMTASATPPVKTLATPDFVSGVSGRLNISETLTSSACEACVAKKSNQEVAAKEPSAPVVFGQPAPSATKRFSAAHLAQIMAAHQEVATQEDGENEIGGGSEAYRPRVLNQPHAPLRHPGVVVNGSWLGIIAGRPRISESHPEGVVRGPATFRPRHFAPHDPAMHEQMVALTIENERLKAIIATHEQAVANAANLTEVLVQNARLEATLEAMENREEIFGQLFETAAQSAAMEAKAEASAEWREERDEMVKAMMEAVVVREVDEAREEAREQNKELQLRVLELEHEILELTAARAQPAAHVSRLPQATSTPHASEE